jgi:hypothetical protein
MKWNFFKPASPYFPFRLFIIVAFLITTWLLYADLTGWRLFTVSNQQQWSAKGPGYHK